MTNQRKFRSDVFLYRMLAIIFATEAGFLAFAFWKCSLPIPGSPVPLVTERCPKLGGRAETLFVAAVATTLSLLSGALSLKNDRDVSSEPTKPQVHLIPESGLVLGSDSDQDQVSHTKVPSGSDSSDPSNSNL